jgi:hypothetical protein
MTMGRGFFAGFRGCSGATGIAFTRIDHKVLTDFVAQGPIDLDINCPYAGHLERQRTLVLTRLARERCAHGLDRVRHGHRRHERTQHDLRIVERRTVLSLEIHEAIKHRPSTVRNALQTNLRSFASLGE